MSSTLASRRSLEFGKDPRNHGGAYPLAGAPAMERALYQLVEAGFVRVAGAHWTFLCDRTKLKQMGVFFVLAGLILFAIVAGIWGVDSRPGFDGGSSNQVRARRDP